MTPTKILFGQLLISLALTVAMIWVATQWTAAQLGYSPRLGTPWFRLGDTPIYKPWLFFWWWYAFEAYTPITFVKGAGIATSGSLFGVGAAIFGSVQRARNPKEVTTYGSAKWADLKEIKSSGLLTNKGVFVGQLTEKKNRLSYLRDDSDTHVLGFAPTRSGKGVGLVVPTLLSWTGSVIVHDIKGENWQLTSGWRAKFSRALCFDPTREESVRFNPLMEIRKGTNEVRDVQNIIDIMIDPQGSLKERSHWDKTSNDLMVAVILHVLYAEKDKTMWGVAKFMSDPSRSFDEMLEHMKASLHLGDRSHPIVAHGAQQAVNMSPNEFSGVLSTAMTLLGLYRDPIVRSVTSVSDFTIDDLVNGDAPLSLYLVVPPSDIARTKPLMRLMLNQILCRLTETMNVGQRNKHRLLLMLDEFPALGRLDFFETALGFIAGYGIKAYLIAQSLNQIEKTYGPNNSIMDNCQVKVTFAANDDRTAKRISESLGTTTEQRAQRNFAGHRLNMWLGHMMVSTQETSRALLTPGEVMQLPQDQAIILMAGVPPILADKVRYFEQSEFNSRILTSAEMRDQGNEPDKSASPVESTGNTQHTSPDEDCVRDQQPEHDRQTAPEQVVDVAEKPSPEKTPAPSLSPIQAQYLDSLEEDLGLGMGGPHG